MVKIVKMLDCNNLYLEPKRKGLPLALLAPRYQYDIRMNVEQYGVTFTILLQEIRKALIPMLCINYMSSTNRDFPGHF